MLESNLEILHPCVNLSFFVLLFIWDSYSAEAAQIAFFIVSWFNILIEANIGLITIMLYTEYIDSVDGAGLHTVCTLYTHILAQLSLLGPKGTVSRTYDSLRVHR